MILYFLYVLSPVKIFSRNIFNPSIFVTLNPSLVHTYIAILIVCTQPGERLDPSPVRSAFCSQGNKSLKDFGCLKPMHPSYVRIASVSYVHRIVAAAGAGAHPPSSHPSILPNKRVHNEAGKKDTNDK